MRPKIILFDEPTSALDPQIVGEVFEVCLLYTSTNAKVLEDLAKNHEIVRLILEFREKTKIKSTYLDTLGPLRRHDGATKKRSPR